MAYDIHISRGYKYADSGHSEITLDEWKYIVSQHKELELINEVETTNPLTKEIIKVRTPNSALFKKKNVEVLFTWKEGIITTKYTTDSNKIYWKEVANWFNAQVFGEEGELIK